jgi:hypothetical protein
MSVFTISQASGAVNVENCTIINSAAQGGATFNAPLSLGNIDGGGNSGWHFTGTNDLGLGNQLNLSVSFGFNMESISSQATVSTKFGSNIDAINNADIPITLDVDGLIDNIAPSASVAATFDAEIVIPPPVAGITVAPYNPSYSWAPVGANFFTLQTVYQCILTGDADSLDDLIIPISSFQSTQRDGDPSYLSCVFPNSVNYIAGIAARPNGDIVVKKGYRYSDGTMNLEEICRADYESLQINRGGRSDSATISGHKTTASSSPASRTLTGVSYYGLQTDGKRTFRAEPDLFLRVGDTAVYGSESIIVGQIAYYVDATLATMQITEA